MLLMQAAILRRLSTFYVWFCLLDWLSQCLANVPHCSNTAAIVAELSQLNYDNHELVFSTNIQAKLGLGETACFQVFFDSPAAHNNTEDSSFLYHYNGSLLYSFTFLGFEHQHPIKSRYTFAIPLVKSKCICDCPGGEDHCNGVHRYHNCTATDGLCLTTYHPHQDASGCTFSGESELCCDVSLSPANSQRFHALYLGQPEGMVILRYMLHKKDEQHDPVLLEDERLTIPINQGQIIAVQKHQLEVRVEGREPMRRLTEGMYFGSANGSSSVRTGVPINMEQEYGLGRLGWYRYEQGQWTIRNGALKLQLAHHVTVTSCMNHKYAENYDAEFYSNDVTTWPEVGVPVEEYYTWIDRTVYTGESARYVTAVHKTAPLMQLDIHVNGKPRVLLGFHESSMEDFHGSIKLDKYSNRYLNLTFVQAIGTVIGAVYDARERQKVDAVLSTYIDAPHAENRSKILELPGAVNSSRWVCFYPSSKPNNERCHLLQYEAEPLQWYVVPSKWAELQGTCADCNQLSVSSFLKYLNPKYWLDGITNSSEALAMGVEIGFYVILAILGICVLRRFVWPALRWTVCGGTNNRVNGLTAQK